MIRAALCLLVAIVMVEGAAASHSKKDDLGEYYEYDIEGTAKEQARRKFRRQNKRIFMFPLGASWQGIRISFKALKKTSQAVEAYLSGHARPYSRGANLNKALTDWEGALHFNPGGHRVNAHSKGGILYIPHESWRLLKYSLYVAGFRVPRKSLKIIKNMVYGTCGLVQHEK